VQDCFFILPNSVVTIYTVCCNIYDTLHFDHTVYTCASVTMWRKSKILYLWHQYRSPAFTQFNQIKNPLIYITWQECASLVTQTSVVVIANLILSCTRKRDIRIAVILSLIYIGKEFSSNFFQSTDAPHRHCSQYHFQGWCLETLWNTTSFFLSAFSVSSLKTVF